MLYKIDACLSVKKSIEIEADSLTEALASAGELNSGHFEDATESSWEIVGANKVNSNFVASDNKANEVLKCIECGAVVWTNSSSCSECMSIDVADAVGFMVDVSELTQDGELREFCAINGYTKHKITSVDNVNGTVKLDDYLYEVKVSDLA